MKKSGGSSSVLRSMVLFCFVSGILSVSLDKTWSISLTERAARAEQPREAPGPPFALPDMAVPVPAGILVFAPVGPGNSEELLNFGTGVGKWLQCAVGGHLELNRTPAWATYPRLKKEFHLPNFRLSHGAALAAAKVSGATHFVYGKLEGQPANLRITLHLETIRPNAEAGAPIVLSGSREAIVSKLAGAAKALCNRIGVARTRIAKAAETPDELALLGSLSWGGNYSLPSSDAVKVCEIAARSDLAMITVITQAWVTPEKKVNDAFDQRIVANPTHALLISVATYNWMSGPKGWDAAQAAGKKFRKLFLLRRVASMVNARNQYAVEAVKNSRDGVAVSPLDPLAWSDLAERLEEQAQSLRKGVMFEQMSASTSATVTKIYLEQLSVAQTAVKLDANYVEGWQQVSLAAAFYGDLKLAETALWKGLKLQPNHVKTLEWAGEMTQPKWGGSREKFDKMMTFISAQKYETVHDLITMARYERNHGRSDLQQKMLSEALRAAEERVAKDRNDIHAHFEAAYLAEDLFDFTLAAAEHAEVLRLFPQSAQLAINHAFAVYKSGDYAKARIQFEEIKEPFRNDAATLLSLAREMMKNQRYDQASPHLQEARRYSRDPWEIDLLEGEILFQQGKYAESISFLEKSKASKPDKVGLLAALPRAYAKLGQTEKALALANADLQANPKDAVTRTAYADILFEARQYAKASKAYRELAAENSFDARAISRQGQAEYLRGNKVKGIALLNQAANMDPTDTDTQAEIAKFKKEHQID